MLGLLKKIFLPSPDREMAQALYVAAVMQARKRFFYEELALPDTLDGRFEAVVLHLSLLVQRLSDESGPPLSRLLGEAFMADMDRSLRELGVGDTGVGKRVKAMAQAYLGRHKAYLESMDDVQTLAAALHRNAYRGAEGREREARVLAEYMRHAAKCIQEQPVESLRLGDVPFPAFPMVTA